MRNAQLDCKAGYGFDRRIARNASSGKARRSGVMQRCISAALCGAAFLFVAGFILIH
ncbi:hypothetical protein LXM94_11530 [Rhizobium sp. TRM95111]|uniref:hypothetical protein n=1 Tax=Rhizobium alarense TaxID=2846851 RepID=UPI001F376272|nr:hypothetical protein [Rhizobium alarense]MCF3640595.1 hypothetical protein [Rhizobium alarense]